MKKLFLFAIRFYQTRISPATPPACKYYPSCSDYAAQCIEIHGAGKGLVLAVWRFLRCNPFSKGGVDPPPHRGKWKKDR